MTVDIATLALRVDALEVKAGTKALGELGTQAGKTEKDVVEMAAGIKKTAGVIATAFTVYAKYILNAADAMNDLHLRTGVAMQSLAMYDEMARQSGTSVNEVANSFKFLGKYMTTHGDSLRALGITSKDTNIAMQQFAEVISRIEDPALRSTLAMEVLGRSGTNLLPLLSGGAAAFKDAAKSTQEYADALERVAPQADKFNDSLAQFSTGAKTSMLNALDAILPSMQKIIDRTVEAQREFGTLFGLLAGVGFTTFSVLGVEIGKAERAQAELNDIVREYGVLREEIARRKESGAEVGTLQLQANALKEQINLRISQNNLETELAAKRSGAERGEKQAADEAAKRIMHRAELERKARAEADHIAQVFHEREMNRIHALFEEGKRGEIAHSQFLLTMELSRIKDTAEAEREANQETADAAIREYLRRGEASAEVNAEYVKQQQEIAKAEEERWKMIDGFAKESFMNIMDKGKDAFKEIGNAIKKYVLEMLYKMTVQKWLINVGILGGGVAATGAAHAATGGGGGIGSFGSSWLTDFSGSASTSIAVAGSKIFEMGGEAAGSWMINNAATIGEYADIAGQGLGYMTAILAARDGQWGKAIGAAVGTYFGGPIGGMLGGMVGGLFGNKGTPGTNVGAAYTTYSPTGTATAQGSWEGLSAATNQTAVSEFTNAMNVSYRNAAKSLGIESAATIFSLSQNLGKDSKAPQFAIRGGVAGEGMPSYFSDWTPQSDAGMILAQSKAIFTALRESVTDATQYLMPAFDLIKDIGAATQPQIDAALQFASTLKQTRDALTETRTPFEILATTVNQGMSELGTSADTFNTDFVSAIDAGMSPEKFQEWSTLWGQFTQQQDMAKAAAEKTHGLEIQLMEAQGLSYAALTAKREQELSALSDTDAAIQRQINAAQDATKTRGLEIQLLELEGNHAEALALQRQQELAGLSATDAAIQMRIYKLQDEAEAVAKANAVSAQRFSLEAEYANLSGDNTLSRIAELQALDPVNRALKIRNWALKDEQDAAKNAAGVAQGAAQAYESAGKAHSEYLRGLVSFGTNIKAFLRDLKTGGMMGTPEQTLSAARGYYTADVAAAKSGDVQAQTRLVESARRYIDVAKGMFGSGERMSAILGQVTADLGGMEAVTQLDANIVALNAIEKAVNTSTEATHAVNQSVRVIPFAITEANLALLDNLSLGFEALDLDMSNTLTYTEFRAGMAGKATDSAIRALFDLTDTNHDGVISALEANAVSIGLSFETWAATQTGTNDELLATFKSLDTNGDQMLSAAELSAGANLNVSDKTNSMNWYLERIANAVEVELRSINYYAWDISRLLYQPLTVRSFSGHGMPTMFANGGAFTNGIVSRPTDFNIGRMGENGAEGILPLANIGGKLGVNSSGNNKEVVAELRDVKATLARLLERGNAAVEKQTQQLVSTVSKSGDKAASATKEAAALAVTN